MGARVLITDNDLGDSRLEIDLLRLELDAEVVVAACVDEADVLAAVAAVDPDAIIVQWAPITAGVLDAAPRCKAVSRIGIGVDMIDLDAAASRDVQVLNVPHYCTEEVASHAVAMAMALWRRLPQLEASMRAGRWDAADHAPAIGRLSTATVGLVGLGRIGLLVARAFEVWGAAVVVADPVAGTDPYSRVALGELVADADIISVHAPLTPSTRHLIGAAQFGAMRRRPVLINTSRGGLVDPVALAAALRSGQVAAAGIDVFETEPLPIDDDLRAAPNVLLTPHAAWCSAQALPELRRQAALNVVRMLGGAVTPTSPTRR